MRRIVFWIVLSVFCSQAVSSQNADHIEGGRFLKRIEYNITILGASEDDYRYNLESKSIFERILFGETNSFVEFVSMDSPEGTDDVTAFRVIKNTQTDSFRLEIMRIFSFLPIFCPYTGQLRCNYYYQLIFLLVTLKRTTYFLHVTL